MTHEVETVLRLCMSAAGGALLGVPSSARGRYGGIRTHALVAMGATLFCVVAERHAPGESARVMAAVITGVGFIGAATVIKLRGVVVGLSNAATIWLASGLGCAAGLGECRLTLALASLLTAVDALLLLVRRRSFPRVPPDGREPGRHG